MAALFEVKKIITGLMAAFPDWKPTDLEKTLDQYADALKGYKVETIQTAVDACRDSCAFFPHIAELKKAINEAWQATTQKSREADKYAEFHPNYSPESQRLMAELRQRMIDKGLWREHRKSPNATRGLRPL